MQPVRMLALVLSTALVAGANAAPLLPHQQAALKKMLAALPAEQRELAHPQLEAALSGLGPEQVRLMLAGVGDDAPGEAAGQAKGGAAAEWGAAEADFEKAFASAQAYIDRISDTHDAVLQRWEGVVGRLKDEWRRAGQSDLVEITALDACRDEFNGIPFGRRSQRSMKDLLAQQDRIQVRQVIEFRARHDSAAGFARAVGQPVSSPMVQAVQHYFSAPWSEGEAKARIAAIEADAAALLERSLREQHRIDQAPYPDGGHGTVSALRQRDLDALRVRTERAARAVCRHGIEAYHRGLVAIVAPVVPKVRRHFGE